MSDFSATSARSSKTTGESVEPRLMTGPGAQVVAAFLVLVDAGRVGGVGHVDGDRECWLEVEGSGACAVEADLLLGVGDARDAARDLVRARRSAARLQERRTSRGGCPSSARPGANPGRASGRADHGGVADPHQLARGIAVLGADVDVKLLELDDLLSLLFLEQVDRLSPRDAGDRPVLGDDLDPLADQDLRVPAADGAEPDEALVVDVGDDEADLVHVPGDREERLRLVVADDGDRRADAVRAHLGEIGRGLAPDGAGRGLVARGSRDLQQVFEKLWRVGHDVGTYLSGFRPCVQRYGLL